MVRNGSVPELSMRYQAFQCHLVMFKLLKPLAKTGKVHDYQRGKLSNTPLALSGETCNLNTFLNSLRKQKTRIV
jgi:hypothetical protein